jgi:hypothetical protein
MDGKEDTVDIPWIKGPIEKFMDNLSPMVLREGSVDITGIPPTPLEHRLDGLAPLDETIGPYMM